MLVTNFAIWKPEGKHDHDPGRAMFITCYMDWLKVPCSPATMVSTMHARCIWLQFPTNQSNEPLVKPASWVGIDTPRNGLLGVHTLYCPHVSPWIVIKYH